MSAAPRRQNTPPLVVSAADLRAHLRVDGTTEDDLLAAQSRAAQDWCEAFTNRSFAYTEWRLGLDAFPPSGTLDLPRSPLRALTAITYVNGTGGTGTLDAATYHLDSLSEPARIVLDSAFTWPETDTRPNAVLVDWTAGYGTGTGTATPDGVPAGIASAIKLAAAELYEHRGDDAPTLGEHEMPPAVKALLSPYRVF